MMLILIDCKYTYLQPVKKKFNKIKKGGFIKMKRKLSILIAVVMILGSFSFAYADADFDPADS